MPYINTVDVGDVVYLLDEHQVVMTMGIVRGKYTLSTLTDSTQRVHLSVLTEADTNTLKVKFEAATFEADNSTPPNWTQIEGKLKMLFTIADARTALEEAAIKKADALRMAASQNPCFGGC